MSFPMEKATYRAKCRRGEFGEASNGSEQVGLEFEVVDGEQKGRRLAYYGSFNGDQATEITIKAMRNAGWTGDDVGDLTSLSRADVPEVELVCEPETWNGKQRLKVKWVNSGGGLAMKKPLDQSKRAALAARVRATVAAVDQGLRSSGKAAPEPAGDIPF